jgi:hypothetical protein
VFLVGCKNKAFKPSCDAINAKYYQLFRGKGGKGLEEDCEEDKEEADEAPRPGGGLPKNVFSLRLVPTLAITTQAQKCWS